MTKNDPKKTEPELTLISDEAETPATPETANSTEELETKTAKAITAAVEEVLTAEQAQIVELQAIIAELETQAVKNVEGWRRTQASFENYRKRTEAEKLRWRAMANAALLMRLLPLVDDFDRAFAGIPAEIEENQWVNGIQLIQQKLHNVLELEQVEPLAVEPGQEFDPHYHEAVHAQVFAGFEEDQIISVVQRGYLQDERVLRPAKVVVALAPEPEAISSEKIIEMDATESIQEQEVTE
ncbi:MAG: nucleotide exchange factor GrpE [Chloroflexota bacterium]|nr:nucleotide exchange factor GrpE [Chloroflexota bacterium]